MITLTITISGRDANDLEIALEYIKKAVGEEYTSGQLGNEDWSYRFDIDGTDDAKEESCNVCGKPDSECQCEFCPNCDYLLEYCTCADEEAE